MGKVKSQGHCDLMRATLENVEQIPIKFGTNLNLDAVNLPAGKSWQRTEKEKDTPTAISATQHAKRGG